MSGNLEEIPLPDLLQLFGSSRKSGVLVIRNDGRTGRIFLNEGLIRYSVIDSQEDLGPLKSVYRLLEWPRGFFELEPPDPREFEQPLDLSAQEVLMEGFRQLDELNQLKERLPGMETRLVLALPLNPPLRSLEPDELDMVQAALNSPNLEAFFERSKLTDLETAKRLETLIRRGYLVPAS